MSIVQKIYAESGDCIAVLSRNDLVVNHQEFLQRNHRAQLFCGCFGRGGVKPAVDVRALPSGRFTLVRESIREHAADCLLRIEDEVVDPLTRRAPGILGLGPEMVGGEGGDRRSRSGATTHYESFNEYAQGAFSNGLARAFVAASQTGAIRSASPTEAMLGVEAALRSLTFSDGLNGFAAAEKFGGRLRLGLIFEEASRISSDLGYHSPVFWWESGRFSNEMVVGPGDLWEVATSRISPFGSPLHAPYFALAVTDAGGTLVRIFLHQVYVSESALLPTESSREQMVADEYARSGWPTIKPIRMEDAVWALRQLGIETPSREQWRYRPDFLRYGCDGLLRVTEVRGFRQGDFPDYDARLSTKAAHFEALLGRGRYSSVDASSFATALDFGTPWDWSNVHVSFGDLSRYSF